MLGQLVGLPTTMALFSFIGIAVTCATVVIFGEAIWDPVALLRRFDNPMIVVISLLALSVATLSTNIAANIVSPANDFSNLRPSLISFRTGGLISGTLGILIMPWRLITDLGNYIFTWLIGYGALLGAIAGVMLVDYFLIRRAHLQVEELYDHEGRYSYGGRGFNWRALVALFAGIAPNVPGFLQAALGAERFAAADFFNQLYIYAWFVGLLVSAGVYAILSIMSPAAAEPAESVSSADSGG
jgi:NCS1 family nucleobase:cation symporter-1